ncbi:MAG: hypothetical protein IJH41_01710 [Eubacterium sp.]|nr:hypothetical protein [Eubacterium sp.]
MKHDKKGSKRALKNVLKVCLVASLSLIIVITGVMIRNTAADREGFDGGDGAVTYAEEVAKKTQDSVESAFPDITVKQDDADTLRKDETVYVIMDADGNETERVVSEWLKNPEKLDTIKDMTDLTDISNTNGDETFEQKGKKLTWAAGGNDIKYTGTSSADLPVSVEVTYYLDGEQVSASEIAGQSGDVEIHFDYGVNARDRITSGGSGFDLTHPYIMASGVVLDNDIFSDVEVSTGRVMSESGSSVCLGIALPGMQDNLALSSDMIDIPESVVIKASTTGFKIDGTYTVALTGLLENIDTDTSEVTDKFSELESALGKLSDASSKLVKGSRKLASGADTLSDGTSKISGGTSKLEKSSKKLASGVSKLTSGSKKLASGTSKIKDGSAAAEKGAKQISDGLDQLSQNSEALNEGTKQIESSVFASATAQLQAMLVAGGMPEEQAAKYVLAPSSYADVLGQLSEALPDYKEAFGQVKASLDSVEKYVGSVKAYTDGVDQISAGADQLSSSMSQLTAGAEAVDEGAGQVYSGLNSLSSKMPELKKGISQLNSGAEKIDSGAGQLAAGADTLADGIAKFDKQGIKKLTGSLDTDEITDILDRLDAVFKASGRRHFMGGAPKNIQGDSRIIFKTGAVE